MSHNTEEIVAKYVAMRDKRSELKAAYQAEDEKIKAAMEVIETYLMVFMKEAGVESLRTNAGTAYKSTTVKPQILDRDEARRFVLASQNLDLLELRASSSGVKQYLQEHGENPPGFGTVVEESVNIRRS